MKFTTNCRVREFREVRVVRVVREARGTFRIQEQ